MNAVLFLSSPSTLQDLCKQSYCPTISTCSFCAQASVFSRFDSHPAIQNLSQLLSFKGSGVPNLTSLEGFREMPWLQSLDLAGSKLNMDVEAFNALQGKPFKSLLTITSHAGY